jgi:hypothetical protein
MLTSGGVPARRKMEPGAVAILKRLQPEDNAAGQEHWLAAINKEAYSERGQNRLAITACQ